MSKQKVEFVHLQDLSQCRYVKIIIIIIVKTSWQSSCKLFVDKWDPVHCNPVFLFVRCGVTLEGSSLWFGLYLASSLFRPSNPRRVSQWTLCSRQRSGIRLHKNATHSVRRVRGKVGYGFGKLYFVLDAFSADLSGPLLWNTFWYQSHLKPKFCHDLYTLGYLTIENTRLFFVDSFGHLMTFCLHMLLSIYVVIFDWAVYISIDFCFNVQCSHRYSIHRWLWQ